MLAQHGYLWRRRRQRSSCVWVVSLGGVAVIFGSLSQTRNGREGRREVVRDVCVNVDTELVSKLLGLLGPRVAGGDLRGRRRGGREGKVGVVKFIKRAVGVTRASGVREGGAGKGRGARAEGGCLRRGDKGRGRERKGRTVITRGLSGEVLGEVLEVLSLELRLGLVVRAGGEGLAVHLGGSVSGCCCVCV